jgi:acid stress chaperone HdeB
MVAALGFVSLVPLSSFAQEINMTSLTCNDFVKSNQETRMNIILWLSGYYTYEDDPPIISFPKISDKENQLRQYCADNLPFGLLEASERFMDKKYKEK